MNSERHILSRLLEGVCEDEIPVDRDLDDLDLDEAEFVADGHIYKCAFGNYSCDGEPITREDYFAAREYIESHYNKTTPPWEREGYEEEDYPRGRPHNPSDDRRNYREPSKDDDHYNKTTPPWEREGYDDRPRGPRGPHNPDDDYDDRIPPWER